MNTRTSTILILILTLGAAVASIWLYGLLPESMASHWNFEGRVDGYTSRLWGALLMPLISAGLYLLFLIIPRIDPLKANIAKFQGTFNAFIVLVVGYLIYLHGLTLAWNFGYTFDMGRMLTPAFGLILFFAGVLIDKSKRNWFIGIRTPWTLSSDRVWDETHRLGAILFKICGVLAFIGVFISSFAWLFVLIPVLGATLFLVIYSYFLYRQEMEAAP